MSNTKKIKPPPPPSRGRRLPPQENRRSARPAPPNRGARNNSNQQLVPKVTRSNVHLSMCAQDYARCLINPFSGPMACIPDFPAIMTRRVRTFARGSFSTSDTTGVGFITMSPTRMAYSDGSAGFMSTAAYTGSTINPNTAAAGVTIYNSNADYTAAQIGLTAAQAQYRIVSAGLRIRYKGTELNRGGQIYALSEPTHDNLQGQTIANVMAQSAARKFQVGSQWTTVLYRPVLNTDDQFSSTAGTGTNDVTPLIANVDYMAFIIEAPSSATSSPFEFEAYAVIEYTGVNVRGIQPSHYDPTGHAAVHSVSQSTVQLPFQGESAKHEMTFLQKVMDYASSAITWVGDHAGEIASIAGAVSMLI